MEIIIIAALGREKQLGLKGQVPWYLPEDFKHFKKTTLGHPIIMGRKTYESLGKPLPKRKNLVIFFGAPLCTGYHSPSERANWNPTQNSIGW